MLAIFALIFALPIFAFEDVPLIQVQKTRELNPNEFIDSEHAHLVFRIKGTTTADFYFLKDHLTEGTFLFEAFKEAENDSQKDKHLAIIELEAEPIIFKMALECLAFGRIENLSYEQIPALIEIAHRFEIGKLCLYIKNFLENSNFKNLDDINELSWFLELVEALDRVPFAAIPIDKPWNKFISDELIKYILFSEKIGDERNIREFLTKNLPPTSVFLRRLLGNDVDLVVEYADFIQVKKLTEAQRIHDARVRAVDQWVDQQAEKIGEKLIDLLHKDKAAHTIEITVEAKDAHLKRDALAKKWPKLKVVLFDPHLYVSPSDEDFAVNSCLKPRYCLEADTCGSGCACGISSLFVCLGGQILQMATCGYCCCMCTDWKSTEDDPCICRTCCDDRTAMGCFSFLYNGFSALRMPNKKLRPSRIIKLSLKKLSG